MKTSVRLLLALPSLVSTLHAAVPLKVNYQSTIYDSTGTPIGATAAVNRKVIFRLYDASTAGNKLWTEEQTVTIYRGEFSIVLGNGTTATGTAINELRPALDTVFTGSSTTRYLEVTIDNGDNTITAADTPTSPRQLLTTTFYAFHAQVADGIASASDLTINPVTGTASNYGLGWYGTGRTWNGTAVDGPVLYGNAGGALGSNASSTKNTALLWNATGQVGIGATGSFTTSSKLTLQGDDTATPARQLIIRGNTDSNEALYLGFDTTNNRATLQSYTSTSTPTAGSLLLNPSGGTIGIGTGTVAPVAKLTVEGSISATGTGGYTFGTGGDADGGLFSPLDGTLTLKTNGNERLRIDSTGRVGIGTTSPSNNLSVQGGTQAATASTSTATAQLGTTAGGGLYFGSFDSTGNYGTWLQSMSAAEATFPTYINPLGGNVGIGTKSTVAKLTVEGSVSATGTGGYVFGTGGDAEGGLFSPADNIVTLNTNGTERVRIDSTGKVGIGTTSTVAKLTVEGSVSATGAGGYVFGTGGDADGGLFSPADGALTLKTNGSERLRVTSNGYVGIGTTTPGYPLQISGGVNFNGTFGYLNNAGNVGRGTNTVSVGLWVDNYAVATEFHASSDARLKENIVPITAEHALRYIQTLSPVQYNWKSGTDKSNKFGFLAQDLLKAGFDGQVGVAPDPKMKASTDETGFVSPEGGRFSINYEQIIPVLTVGIQELSRELSSKDAELKAVQLKLEAEQKVVSAQEARIAALEVQGQDLEAKHVVQQAEQNAKLAALERLITRQLDGKPPVAVKHVSSTRAE